MMMGRMTARLRREYATNSSVELHGTNRPDSVNLDTNRESSGPSHYFREVMQMTADNMIKLALITIMLDNKYAS